MLRLVHHLLHGTVHVCPVQAEFLGQLLGGAATFHLPDKELHLPEDVIGGGGLRFEDAHGNEVAAQLQLGIGEGSVGGLRKVRFS